MMTGRILFLLSTLCYSGALAQAPDSTVMVYGKGIRGPYFLGIRNLIENSITVNRNGVALSPDSFTVERAQGLLFMVNPLSINDSVAINFSYLPLNLKSRYYIYSLEEVRQDTLPDEPRIVTKSESFSSDLKIVGSKGFSIQSGDGIGNNLSQSLNLSITGELIPGLQTSAHISDKSSGQSGVSRRLNELDKIYIQAESDHFKGVFGDFDFVQSNDPLLAYQRKLTGINAIYSKRANRVSGAAAFFPGEYASITINGQDGRLGPYYLTDKGGRQGAVILPGSERIYIDGILQKRGSQNDYEIDYEAGAIQFAPSKIIKDESRITIDYELSREEYSRAFYTVSGESYPRTGLRLYSSLLQEGDSRGSPKSFELGIEEKAILDSAGADRLAAQRSGVRYVGLGLGDYNLDTSGVAHFIYVGSDIGEYDITFSFVGIDAGSYSSRGGGIYEFSGLGIGDYEPVILIPIPQIKRYGSIGGEWISSDSVLNLSGELVGSINDRNTYSRRDNADPAAAAVFEFALKQKAFHRGFWGVQGKARQISERAVFPGRVDNIERYRKYDLNSSQSNAGEKMEEAAISGGMDMRRFLSYEVGHLAQPQLKERLYQATKLNWRLWGPLDFASSVERTDGDRTWWKHSDRLAANFRNLQPNIRFNFERRDKVDGFMFYEYLTEIPASYTGDFSGITSISFRDEKYIDTIWRDKFISGTIQQSLNFVAGRSGFSGELAGSYYKKSYRQFPGTDSEQKTGQGRLSFTDREGRGAVSVNERLISSNERLQAKNYIYVGDGKGDYRLEDGEYLRDPQGDYIAVIEELGEGTKITEVATEINGALSPFLIADPSRNIEDRAGRLSMETTLNYQLKRSANEPHGRDFAPWKSDDLTDIVLQSGELNMRIYYYPPQGNHRVKYNLIRSFETGNPYANEITDNSVNSDEISWAFPATNTVDLSIAMLTSRQERSTNEIGYKYNRKKGSVTANYRVRKLWTISSGFSYENIKQSNTGMRADMPTVEVGITRDFIKSGKLSAKFGYARMNVSPANVYIPFQAAQGRGSGDNYDATIAGRLSVSQSGRFDISYRYEDFSRRATRNVFRLEFTLLFI